MTSSVLPTELITSPVTEEAYLRNSGARLRLDPEEPHAHVVFPPKNIGGPFSGPPAGVWNAVSLNVCRRIPYLASIDYSVQT